MITLTHSQLLPASVHPVPARDVSAIEVKLLNVDERNGSLFNTLHARSRARFLATYLPTYRAPRRRENATYLLFGTSGTELRSSRKDQTLGSPTRWAKSPMLAAVPNAGGCLRGSWYRGRHGLSHWHGGSSKSRSKGHRGRSCLHTWLRPSVELAGAANYLMDEQPEHATSFVNVPADRARRAAVRTTTAMPAQSELQET